MTRVVLRAGSAWIGAAVTALASSACDSELITLGRIPSGSGSGSGTGGMPALSFGEPRRLVELGSDEKDDNATLTEDLRHVYFTSTRGNDADVYHAFRSSPDAAFEMPERFAPGSTDDSDFSPAISLDGETLWVGHDHEDNLGQTDIWVTTFDGAIWTALRNVTELNSPEDDIPRPAAGQNLVMPLGSKRSGADADYRTFLAVRPNEAEPFATPQSIPELETGARIVDGFLTEDLLMLFYSSGDGENAGDLWLARRSNANAAFGTPEPLSELNTDWDERDPWVAPDLSRIVFTSDRFENGNHEIFEAAITLR